MATNLPSRDIQDSAQSTKVFFDTYGQQPLEFQANEVEAARNFFESKGFASDAATTTSITILKQAKIEGIPVFKILDTLSGLTSIQLSALVGEILNNNRPSTSTLGYRLASVTKQNQTRNIIA